MLTFRRALEWVLAGWFVVISAALVLGPALAGRPVRLGWDAVVYAQAAQAVIAGGNPWTTEVFGITYAAPPPSLLLYLPFAWLPDVVAAVSWVAIGAASAVYSVRRLRLPSWWLAFPPLVLGVAAGSSAPLVLALLVRCGVVADAAAVVTRLYAAVPVLVLGRWRAVLMAAAVVLSTAPFLEWPRFLESWPSIASTLTVQANGGLSAVVAPVLIVLAIGSLILLGRKRAAWLIVPALWPDTQLYYASIALPVLGQMPLVALALASPASPGLIALGMAGQVVLERVSPRLRRRQQWIRLFGQPSVEGRQVQPAGSEPLPWEGPD